MLVDEEPVCSKPYPLPYALRQELKDEIKEMLDMGISQKLSSPYVSSVVIVRKKDGSNHSCIDYRKLSKLTILDPYPMKILKNLFQQFRKSLFFSKINLSKSNVGKENVSKTVFVTPEEHINFSKSPLACKIPVQR